MHLVHHQRRPRRQMLKSLLGGAALTVAAPALTATAAGQSGTPADVDTVDPSIPRGEVLSVTPVASMSADEVARYVGQIGLEAQDFRFGVDAWQVIYASVDFTGEPTIASGLVVLPDSDTSNLQLVSWLHGTTVYRGDAASVSVESADRMVAFAIAAVGYGVAAPDYLGLGLGPGFHPYDRIPSTVTASIDAL